MAGVGRVGRSTESSVGTALRAARVARAPSRPMSSAGGWMPRAMSRSSVIASLAPRWAASTSSRPGRGRRGRGRPRASPSPCRAAWPAPPAGPGCRRAGRARSGAASPPRRRRSGSGPARACARGSPSGRGRAGPDQQAVDVDEAPHDPRRGKEEDGAEDEDADLVDEARRGRVGDAGEDAAGQPQTWGPPPSRPKSGWIKQVKASHHRLTATKTPRMVHGTLTAR